MPRGIVWTVSNPRIRGTEMCRLHDDAADHPRLEGTVVAVDEDIPVTVRYDVVTDAGWLTRNVDIRVRTFDADHTLHLEHDGAGVWEIDGTPRPDLAGCADVDIGVTPATNTLPIRRLSLAVGEQADIVAAWVRFPTLRVEAGHQSYERLGEHTYRYRSGGFAADLAVDEAGLVVKYGEDLWRTVAGGRPRDREGF